MQTQELNVGDRVTWLQRRRIGSQIELATKEGVIESIRDGVATVKPDKKYARRSRISLDYLRRHGRRTELMEVLDQVLPSKKGGEG